MGDREDQVGAVTGLAWTEVGGELLTIEAVTVSGKGQLRTTGKLGEVMTESVQAAPSFVKARAPAYGIRPSIFERKRSEERRVGKERAGTCRTRWSPYHITNNRRVSRHTRQ